jgi:hypothetical protein
MKKAMLIVMTVGALILVTGLMAAAATAPIRVNIPFAFQAGAASLPAGTYVVELGGGKGLNSHIILHMADGSDTFFVPVSPATQMSPQSFRLLFSRYGDTYFLSKVVDGGVETTLMKSDAEKKLASTAATKTLVAALRAR